jgi:hypothetical protein
LVFSNIVEFKKHHDPLGLKDCLEQEFKKITSNNEDYRGNPYASEEEQKCLSEFDIGLCRMFTYLDPTKFPEVFILFPRMSAEGEYP